MRAIAILMVIVHHALNGHPGFTRMQIFTLRPTGQSWPGVDLFFVLSGFLSTGVLIDERGSTCLLRSFIARRILRIVPLYNVFLSFSLWRAAAIGASCAAESTQPHETEQLYWTYSVNILIVLRNWSAMTLPTGHHWSLAVEEQFYLIWPFVVLLLSPQALRRATISCIICAEFCRLAFVLACGSGQVNFVLLPCRLDTRAAGAYLACAYRDDALWQRVLRGRQALSLVALVLVFAVILYRQTIDNQESVEQLIFFPATVAFGAVIVSSAATGNARLSNRAVRFLAKISYGMYLWHVVVIKLILSKIRAPETTSIQRWWTLHAVMVGGTRCGTIVLAFIRWYCMNQPFLKLKRFVPST